ncbi:hypothetical protein PsYK624_019290 [Phanerochaete sordida]|uniref:Uncharacterized protein n=1 Tax=Phanerochaete sordida TaxID=48140 RepID=A0A9P3G0T2_9APHY|nr:hypothetical protein PsYK624_019290 [Phanerochaete sordida]
MSAQPSSSQSKWWSRSKSSKDVYPTRSNPPSGLPEMKPFPTIKHSKSKDSMTTSKLNNLVGHAFGKRSKKPTLTIQDPPPSVLSSSSSTYSRSTPATAATSPVYSPQPFFSNRPPAKSVASTVRSYEFDERSDPHTISEPRTPSDRPDRRSYQNSVFTLSDPDPFAAGSVIVPHFPQDPNRLSVYSDSSMLDPHGVKRFDAVHTNRISYGSSSSNSHSSPYDPYSPTSPSSSEMPSRRPSQNQGEKRNRRETFILTDGACDDPTGFDIAHGISERFQSGSVSSGSTVVPRQRFVSAATVFQAPEPLSREPARARGMTVAGDKARRPTINTAFTAPPAALPTQSRLQRQASQPLSQHSESPTTTATASPVMFSARSSISTGSATPHPPIASTRPLVLVRKASSSRVNLPPLTILPPTHLPPPPLSPLPLSDDVDSVESLVFPDPPSAGSSSFASLDDFPTAEEAHHFMTDEPTDPVLYGSPSPLQTFDLASPGDRYADERRDPSSSELSLTSPAEKRISGFSAQFIMERRASEASVNSARTSSYDDHGSASSTMSKKGPKKQRSFPRLPLPGLRHNSNGPTSPEAQQTPRSPSLTGSPQPRRRLFSGSSLRRGSVSKGSSSPPPTADDELRSMPHFSLDDSPPPRDTPAVQREHRPIMMSFTNMGNQLALVTENACIAPKWPEMLEAQTQPPPAPKRLSTTDYVPQRIMSPTDMLKLEQQFAADNARAREPTDRRQSKHDLDPADYGLAYVGGGHASSPMRSRAGSVLSTMSSNTHAMSDDGAEDAGTFGRLGPARPSGSSGRRPSTTELASPLRPGPLSRGLVPSPGSSRPSTAQASLASPPQTPAQEQPPSPLHATTALPPPPRPRQTRGHVREDSALTQASHRQSVVPLHPLSPPPMRRKNSRATTIAEDEPEPAGAAAGPASPPRPPSAFEQKALRRRSVMRKPSFLEIDDDGEEDDADLDFAREACGGAAVRAGLADIDERRTLADEPEEMESSFLDLDRSSFDTVRSYDGEAAYAHQHQHQHAYQPSFHGSFQAF